MSPAGNKPGGGALAELSTQLADAVEAAGKSVVSIHARRRIPSSGVIWREGVIVSASHTVKGNDDIRITLPSGESASATIAGRDSATDLIALRAPGAKSPVARHADESALRVGALVLAVGRPGAAVTASFGIVSAVGESWRSWQGSRVDRIARLDLNVYDGFSGSPLVDASGAVLGINNSALAQGTPLALPASVVDRVLDELLQRGHVRRPYIGIAVHPVALNAAAVKGHGLSQDAALVVLSAEEGAPADRAGILVGDVLLEVDGQALKRPADLLDTLSAAGTGTSITFKVLRGGTVKTVSLKPADRGDRT
jgi:S1-C subfamily serine protease